MNDPDVTMRTSTLESVIRDAKFRERSRVRRHVLREINKLCDRDEAQGFHVGVRMALSVADTATRAPRRQAKRRAGKEGAK